MKWSVVKTGYATRVKIDDKTEVDISLDVMQDPGPIEVVINLYSAGFQMCRFADFLARSGLMTEHVKEGHPDFEALGECVISRYTESSMRDAKVRAELWLQGYNEALNLN